MYSPEIEQTMRTFFAVLSERDRRLYAAVEASKLGHGGICYIASVLGCCERTICRGLDELRQLLYFLPATTRARIRSMAVSSTGFVRWKSNPASLDRRLSSSLPQPVRATSTAPPSVVSARRRFATS